MAKNKYYLVDVVKNDIHFPFIMLNATEPITNRMCNSTIFPKNSSDCYLDISVFDYFKCELYIIEKLDRRTKRFKELENKYKYFSVSFFTK